MNFNFLFYPLAKKLAVGGALIAFLAGIVFLAWPGTVEKLDIISSNPNPFIRQFAPAWNSLKRIGDLPYIVLYSMRGSQLPVYEITLSPKDKEALLSNLPDYPRVAAMWEEYKKTVKGEFRTGAYRTSDADIRIRGISPNHWAAAKKSWQINLPLDKPLEERATLRLILPEDKGWIFHAVNAERARELGLISPAVSYIRLHVNGVDMGVYQLVEGWEESMLEKNGRGLAPLFSNLNLDIRDINLMRPDSLPIWENRFETETHPAAMHTLSYFLDLVANAPDDVFEKELPFIVDMDIFNRWLVVTALSGNFHQGNIANQNWYFSPTTGKLEPILFDTALAPITQELSLENNRLVSRAMRIPAFRKKFSDMLKTYLADTSHKERALASYDALFNSIRTDILSDTKKIDTSAAVLRQIQKERSVVAENYDALRRMRDKTDTIAFTFADETYPITETFSKARYADSFLMHSAPLSEFLQKNPQFFSQDKHTLRLLAGTYAFRKTVIIPEGYMVEIDPGTRLLFAPGVSLFSYSAVHSNGTAARPIFIQSLNPQKPWGVFAVLNAPEPSVFRHTYIKDGSEAEFVGLYFSGSLSMRSSDLEFLDGSVSSSRADDGIHVYGSRAHIARSLFEDTSSDSIDIDFAKVESLFEKNTFRETGGDAIDLSFSKITVRENTVAGCGDKGISVGETSESIIEKNIVIGCIFGIAVKDRSQARIVDTLLLANETGIGVYRKKPHFIEGGHAFVSDSTLWANGTPVSIDEFSTAEGIPPQENSSLDSWKNKLSAELFMYVETILLKF